MFRLDPVDLIVITDQFNPILSDLTVTFNGTAWAEGTQYTYDQTTGFSPPKLVKSPFLLPHLPRMQTLEHGASFLAPAPW